MSLEIKSSSNPEILCTRVVEKDNTFGYWINIKPESDEHYRQFVKRLPTGKNLTFLYSEADKTHYIHIAKINNNLPSSWRTWHHHCSNITHPNFIWSFGEPSVLATQFQPEEKTISRIFLAGGTFASRSKEPTEVSLLSSYRNWEIGEQSSLMLTFQRDGSHILPKEMSES